MKSPSILIPLTIKKGLLSSRPTPAEYRATVFIQNQVVKDTAEEDLRELIEHGILTLTLMLG